MRASWYGVSSTADPDPTLRLLGRPVRAIASFVVDPGAERARDGTDLPPLYWRYFRTWVALGVPAFIAFVFSFWFMVAKPS